ncbi:unnamed protein product [Trichobilharzia szidati]|nr:unnamed protein product [Trichobilharzia szidati]
MTFAVRQRFLFHTILIVSLNILIAWKYTTCAAYGDQSYQFQTNSDYTYELPDSQGFLVEFNQQWPSKDVNTKLGVVSSIKGADESGSDVYVLHRGDRIWDMNTFDQQNNYRLNKSEPIKDGVLVRILDGEIRETYLPEKFYLPHGLTIDPDGNFWITDVALHQVFKFSPHLSSEPLLVLGERFKPGSGENQFCKPTDVVVSTNGQVFISDGYCNSRIMKFDGSGKLLKSWGHETKNRTHPGPDELNLPHQLALFENEDTLCVADRINARVVCYKAGLYSDNNEDTGKYLFEYIQSESRPIYGVTIEPKKKLIFALVGSTEGKDDSKVEIIDFTTQNKIDEIKNDWKTGFGDVHSISTCPYAWKTSCLLFCNTNTPSHLKGQLSQRVEGNSEEQDEALQEELDRRLWLYHLSFDTEQNRIY